jgi:hypothetical protein
VPPIFGKTRFIEVANNYSGGGKTFRETMHDLEESGGEGGIRTHGRVSPTHAFQACSFNHSDTSPPVEAQSD